MIACLFLFSRKRSLVICTGGLIASRFKNPDETIDTCTFENLYWVSFHSLLHRYFLGKKTKETTREKFVQSSIKFWSIKVKILGYTSINFDGL